MTKRAKEPVKPPKKVYEARRIKCKYCRLEFTAPATAAGQRMEFCRQSHRWAYAREGKKPIDYIMKKYEKRMREIAREEADNAVKRLAEQCGLFDQKEVTPLPEIIREIVRQENSALSIEILKHSRPIGREVAQALSDSFSPCKTT